MFHDRQMTETDMINLYPRCKRETQHLAQRVLDYLADGDILERSKVTRDEYIIQWENLNEEAK